MQEQALQSQRPLEDHVEAVAVDSTCRSFQAFCSQFGMACFEAPPPGMLDCWFRCSPPPEHSCASLKVTHCIRLDYNCEQIVNPATHIKKYSSRPDTLLGGPKIAGTMPLATRYDASHYPRRVPQSR